jgi:hypothetical protein
MKCRRLAVLMWKHLIVRKQRFILTAVELLSPIFFIVILFLIRDDINPVSRHATKTNQMNIEQPVSLFWQTKLHSYVTKKLLMLPFVDYNVSY